MKKISFIIPIYNTPLERLKVCIASILAIRGILYEIIIVDDGSMQELHESYSAYIVSLDSPNIRLVQQANKGVSAARNVGIAMADGEYVMFVDSDDSILSDGFEDAYYADLVLFCYVFVKGRNRAVVKSVVAGESGDISYEDLAWTILQGKLRACRHLYKRKFLLEHNIQFEEGCIQGEDADFNFLFMTMHPSVQYINKPVYRYCYSSQTSMQRWRSFPKKMIQNEAARYKRFVEYLPTVFPKDYSYRLRELSLMRIRDIYESAVNLCCTGQDTEENKSILEQLMTQLVLPPTADGFAKMCYNVITQRRWRLIAILARLRTYYLRVRGI